MKTIQIFKPKSLYIINIEKPSLTEENNVLIRMTAAGICGSDMDIYHDTNAAAIYPRIIGHEMVDVVEGTVSSVASLRPGDCVIVNRVTNCDHYCPCRIGGGDVCNDLVVRSMHIDGGHQGYTTAPQEGCCLLSDSVSDTDAVMIELAAIIIRSCTRVELRKDDMFLIHGCDVLRSSILGIARLFYDYTIVTDMIDEKLEGAKSAGTAHTIGVLKEDLEKKIREYTHGHGATVSIDMVCRSDPLIRLLKATDNTGRVITMGFSTSPIEINQFLITSKELDVWGSHLQNKMFSRAVELINGGEA